MLRTYENICSNLDKLDRILQEPRTKSVCRGRLYTMTVVLPASDSAIIPGITHLLVDGKYTPLLKCPHCNSLRNIHVKVIEQHIRIDHPGNSYHVSEFYPKVVRYTSPYGLNITKGEISLPWIRCLFFTLQGQD